MPPRVWLLERGSEMSLGPRRFRGPPLSPEKDPGIPCLVSLSLSSMALASIFPPLRQHVVSGSPPAIQLSGGGRVWGAAFAGISNNVTFASSSSCQLCHTSALPLLSVPGDPSHQRQSLAPSHNSASV